MWAVTGPLGAESGPLGGEKVLGADESSVGRWSTVRVGKGSLGDGDRFRGPWQEREGRWSVKLGWIGIRRLALARVSWDPWIN